MIERSEARNLWELVEARAAATPDKQMALDEEGRTLTYGELRHRAERTAAGLAGAGITEGDVVSWQLPTWLESAVLVAALSRLGAVQNPMLPIYRQREVGFICRQAASKLLVVPSAWRGFDYKAMADAIAGELGGLEVLVCDRALPERDPASLPAPPPPPATPAEAPVRWLFYTSGTTAEPKGARHTDATILASAVGMSERLALRDDDRAAMVFPFTHIGGQDWLFSTLLTGCLLLFVEAWDPKGTPQFLAEQGMTVAPAGTVFHMAYLAAQRERPDDPLYPDLRVAVGGGAPKPPQLHYDVKRELGGVGIASGYGLTEAPIIACAGVDDDDEILANTEGRAAGGATLRVVKLDGSPAGPGEDGEIRAKGPQLMLGYLDSTLDADAFDDEGWFRTGDIGRLDERGNVTITGRVKDIIIRKGENISAKEVEDLLFTHPAIADVAVIGLPDRASGERCCAVVVLEEGTPPPALADIATFCRDAGLMTQKIPEQLEVVDVLPRNPTGKVLKYELRARFSD